MKHTETQGQVVGSRVVRGFRAGGKVASVGQNERAVGQAKASEIATEVEKKKKFSGLPSFRPG
jgi:hypothetical protein